MWPDIVRHAADHGVKIAIENCPMIFSADEWPGGNNLMYAPATWRRVRRPRRRHPRAQPRPVAPGVADDRLRARRPRVRVADLPRPRQGHGDRSRRAVRPWRDVGGDGLAGARLPGLGEIRWDRFISALYRAGYDYAVVVEHEDRGFEGSDEKVKAGFHIARDAVARYIA